MGVANEVIEGVYGTIECVDKVIHLIMMSWRM